MGPNQTNGTWCRVCCILPCRRVCYADIGSVVSSLRHFSYSVLLAVISLHHSPPNIFFISFQYTQIFKTIIKNYFLLRQKFILIYMQYTYFSMIVPYLTRMVAAVEKKFFNNFFLKGNLLIISFFSREELY